MVMLHQNKLRIAQVCFSLARQHKLALKEDMGALILTLLSRNGRRLYRKQGRSEADVKEAPQTQEEAQVQHCLPQVWR